jgi:hypothetical protein
MVKSTCKRRCKQAELGAAANCDTLGRASRPMLDRMGASPGLKGKESQSRPSHTCAKQKSATAKSLLSVHGAEMTRAVRWSIFLTSSVRGSRWCGSMRSAPGIILRTICAIAAFPSNS